MKYESLFNSKASITTNTGIVMIKIDIVKYDNSIEIRLIDISSIFSLFISTITKSEYIILKRDQDILVDFDKFISVIVDLFYKLSKNTISATFHDGKLRFIENDDFRNICKLELSFVKPEEKSFKRYIGDLFSRMEGDNIKLVKENVILRDKCQHGDRELKEKMKSLEFDIIEYKRKLDIVIKENDDLVKNLEVESDEVKRLEDNLYEVESDYNKMKKEIEKFEKEKGESIKDMVDRMIKEIEKLKKDNNLMRLGNEELVDKNKELKKEKEELSVNLKKDKNFSKEIEVKYNDMTSKMKITEDKYKNVSKELKTKQEEIDKLKVENKKLKKKVVESQSVYNHFSDKIYSGMKDYDYDNYSNRPESPPPKH